MKRLAFVIALLPRRPSPCRPILSQSFTADTFSGLRARSIGPAVTSGRVVTIAVDPANTAVFYVGAASGGVWKTVNAGTTWTPVFDAQGSYSIGCVTLDPKSPNVVWVGTGENNSQRSVGYGDGVYKSDDGGTDVDERRAQELRAHRQDPHRPARLEHRLRRGAGAAVGAGRRPRPLQDDRRRQDLEAGAQRSARTPASPTSSSIRATPTCSIAAALPAPAARLDADQRRARRARIHRSTDGGKTWKKVTTGLPDERAGPHRPGDRAGEPRHRLRHRRGGERQGRHLPLDRRRRDVGEAQRLRPGRDVLRRHRRRSGERRPRLRRRTCIIQVSDDGGKTLRGARRAEQARRQPRHLDRPGQHRPPARRLRRRPLRELRPRRALDASSRTCRSRSSTTSTSTTPRRSTTSTAARRTTTRSAARRARAAEHGILNEDWFVTQGGDGFQSRVDPDGSRTSSTPSCSTAASSASTGGPASASASSRRRSKGGAPLRWNWDSPLIISPALAHAALLRRADRLFRSDDRGDTWKADLAAT